MKFSAVILVSVLLSATGAFASEHHDAVAAGVSRRHHHVARNQARSGGSSAPAKRGNGGRCRPRPTSSPAPQNTPPPSSAKQDPLPTTSVPPQPTQNTNNANDNNNNNGNNGNNNNNNNSVPSNSQLIGINQGCQGIPVGATSDVTQTSGPNGSQDWLMCGINSGGWQPPHVTINDLKIMDLGEAMKDPKSPFHACSAFIDKFYQYGAEFGIPAIVLASTAMQESSCNPNTVGGGGEQGLMQITHDKCGGAPGGNCRDIDYNIRTGAKFFSDTLNACNGNVLLTLGKYNGYYPGLTIDKATAARWSSCCTCQNNLDYLQQTVNGWYQNINVYGGMVLGKYQNLAACIH